MIPRIVKRAVIAAALLLPAMVGVQFAGAAVASAANAPQVLSYDASASAEFADAVDAGAQVWNDNVANVRLEAAEPGEAANIEIIADDGWPRAYVESLGNGTIYMGRQATDEGHDAIRIAAHELGHILGLPDMKPGPCSSLMSGASAGTDCTNAIPDEAEKAEVEANFGTRHAEAKRQNQHLVYQD